MRRLAILLLLACSPLAAQTPTFTQNGAMPYTNVTSGDGPTKLYLQLPFPTTAGGTIVGQVESGTAFSGTWTLADDGGDTFVQPASAKCVDSTNGNQIQGFYAMNVAAGTKLITATVSSGTAPYSQIHGQEFYNVASTSALDVAKCSTAGASGTALTTAATGTLSASGELVVQYATVDSGNGSAPPYTVTSWTPGSQANITWKLLAGMVMDSAPTGVQYGVYNSTASFSPTINVNASISYVSLAMVFKKATQGSAPAAGTRVYSVQHDNTVNETSTSLTQEIPVLQSNSAVLVMFLSGCVTTSSTDCYYATGASGGLTWTQIGSNIIAAGTVGDGSGGVGQVWCAGGNVAAGNYSVTWTMHARSTGGNGATFMTFVVTGAAAGSACPVDPNFGGAGVALASATGDQPVAGAGGNLTTLTLTPNIASGIVLADVGIAYDTITGAAAPTGNYYQPCQYTGESNPSHCDENNGWLIFPTGSSLTSSSYTWTHNTINNPGVGYWISLAVDVVPTLSSGASPSGRAIIF